jgi:hypothetical protein
MYRHNRKFVVIMTLMIVGVVVLGAKLAVGLLYSHTSHASDDSASKLIHSSCLHQEYCSMFDQYYDVVHRVIVTDLHA